MTGVLAALTLAAAVTIKDIFSKRVSTSISGALSTFASFAYALPFYLALLPLLWIAGYENFTIAAGFSLWIVLRSLSDLGAEWSKMESIARGDLSLVSAFQSLSPAFLVILSPLITGDPITPNSALGLLIITISGVLLAEPYKRTSAAHGQASGILLGVLCAFFFSLNHCFDRLAAQTASAPLSAFAMTALAALFMLPFVRGAPLSQRLDRASKGLWGRAVFEVIGMIAKLVALQHLSAPTVVAIARLSVPLSIAAAALLLHERHFFRRIVLGSIMALGSAVTVFG